MTEKNTATCEECDAKMRGVLPNGKCGWCATKRHPDRLSRRMELYRQGKFTPPPDAHAPGAKRKK